MLIAGLLLTTTAVAFEPSVNRHGAEVQWERMPVYWAYDDAGRPDDVSRAEAVDAIRASFEAWNEVRGARVRFIEDDGLTPPDELNHVYWDDAWSWDDDILALTSTWSREDGSLARFDIAINAVHPPWSVDGSSEHMDLQNAMTHEVGHALGLAHDKQVRDATMAPTAGLGETRKRDLHRSDQQGARYLYPGSATASCSSTRTPPSLLWTLALGVLVALGVRRGRRKETPR